MKKNKKKPYRSNETQMVNLNNRSILFPVLTNLINLFKHNTSIYMMVAGNNKGAPPAFISIWLLFSRDAGLCEI